MRLKSVFHALHQPLNCINILLCGSVFPVFCVQAVNKSVKITNSAFIYDFIFLNMAFTLPADNYVITVICFITFCRHSLVYRNQVDYLFSLCPGQNNYSNRSAFKTKRNVNCSFLDVNNQFQYFFCTAMESSFSKDSIVMKKASHQDAFVRNILLPFLCHIILHITMVQGIPPRLAYRQRSIAVNLHSLP